MTEHNPGGEFLYKVGDRVWYKGERVRVVDRTVEPALGKTYEIRYPNRRSGGYIPESMLSKQEQ